MVVKLESIYSGHYCLIRIPYCSPWSTLIGLCMILWYRIALVPDWLPDAGAFAQVAGILEKILEAQPS